MSSYLADFIDFGGHRLPREEFVNFCKQGNPWEDVKLIAAHFSESGGAILYEGFDTGSKRLIRVGEFIKVTDGFITTSMASFGSGQPPV